MFAILRSSAISKEGSRIRLLAIAKSKVVEISPPNAFVPPKLDKVKMEKPKNNTIEV